jgi:effector-binding domain-containing protein
MKIIKYLFLLILLALIGFSVYIATQNGNYTVQRSTFIKVPKEIVFNYINDYRNWDQWLDLDVDSSDVKFDFPENTVGQGGSFSWKKDSEMGQIKTIFVKENDSVSQNMIQNQQVLKSSLKLKDSIGGTKLSWSVEGSADFLTKIEAAFNGGIETFTAKMFQNSLNNLNAIITKEIRNYSVKVIGKVTVDEGFYVKQTATAKVRDLNAKITPMLQRMDKFFKSGNIQMNGKPFIIYESSNAVNGTITFSVCGPLKEEIFVSEPSDVVIAKLESFSALKTILKGDYSHRNEAIKKALAYLSENNIKRNSALKFIDVYTVNASSEKSPSKWITEVLIPIEAPIAAALVYIKTPIVPVEETVEE